MRRRSERLASLFAKLQGCEEWGVRIMRGPARPVVKGAGKPATGTAFLAARKRARDQSLAAVRDSAQAADDAYALLAEIAADHRRRQQEATGVIPPLLDAAFLVPVRRRARFRAVAERAAKDVLRAWWKADADRTVACLQLRLGAGEAGVKRSRRHSTVPRERPPKRRSQSASAIAGQHATAAAGAPGRPHHRRVRLLAARRARQPAQSRSGRECRSHPRACRRGPRVREAVGAALRCG